MFKNFLLIIVKCAVVHGQITPFIFGGKPVSDNSYGFMVFIQYYRNESYSNICSGSLIHEKWILTASHCFEIIPKPENSVVIAGTPQIPLNMTFDKNELQIRNYVKMIYIHEGYDFADEREYDNDIALVELDAPFILNENVTTLNYSEERSKMSLICTTLGFGYTEFTSVGALYAITNNVILPPETCQAARNDYRLNNHFVCLLNHTRGICSGDSGGPLVCNGKIYAISVASASIVKNRTCISVTESYFLIVEPYTTWIQDRMLLKPTSKANPNYVLVAALAVVFAFLVLTFLTVCGYCCMIRYKDRLPQWFKWGREDYSRVSMKSIKDDSDVCDML